MMETQQADAVIGRRTLLVRAIAAIYAAIGATVAAVLGGSILAPSLQHRTSLWWRASSLTAVPDREPLVVTVRVARQDGFTPVVDRVIIYLVKVGKHDVRALQSSCTHLGCRTSYDREMKRIVCPCHGGVYDTQGNVVTGPPPGPLRPLATRIENGQVLVQI